jgi:hypothetical protein
VKVTCDFCGMKVEEEGVKFKLSIGDRVFNFCTLSCLYNSEPLEDLKHRSLSSLILNKTFFEVLAIITGLGGVYFTLFEAGKSALIMDTVSVIAAIAAMIIGVEHLRYVEEHDLLRRAVLFVGLVGLISILLFVWLHGFS